MWFLKIIFVLFFAVTMSLRPDEDNKMYKNAEKLITEYRDLYHASHIFIACGESYDGLKVSTTFFRLFMHFSQQNVYSMITRIVEIPEVIAHGKKRPGRPFFIVFISSMEDFQTFSAVTKIININLYKILVVFRSNLDFCEEPRGNPLNLVYSTRMLIKCGNSSIIREWYSLYPNKTEVFELFDWKPDVVGFSRLTNLTFQKRRNSLNGISLRVTLLEDSISKTEKMTGFFASLIREVANISNFKIDLQPYETHTGSHDPKTNKWSGIIGKLNDKKIDIGVGEFTMTLDRLDVIDFSNPVAISQINFYVKEPAEYLLMWSMYYKAYGWRASYCLVFFLLVSPMIITLTMKRTSTSKLYTNIYDNYIQVWGVFCNITLSEYPKNTPTRIAYFSLFVLAYLLYSSYSALLVSYLTVVKPDLPFNSIDGFIAAKSHRITTVRNSTYIDTFLMVRDNPLIEQLNKLLVEETERPRSLSTALKDVCDDSKKVIIYIDELIVKGERFKIPCKLIPFERVGLSNLAFTFVQDSPYVSLINHHLGRMRDFGIVNAVKSRNTKKTATQLTVFESVDLWSTIPMFGILYLGMFLSIVVLVFENIFNCRFKKR